MARFMLQSFPHGEEQVKSNLDDLRRSIELADGLVELADSASEDCRDDGCLVVYGIMRDSGYKIRASAEQAIKQHVAGGAANYGLE